MARGAARGAARWTARWTARGAGQVLATLGRLRSVYQFQVAAELQAVLDAALPGAQQTALLVLAAVGFDLAARAEGAGLGLLRDVAVIQLGQSVMSNAGALEAGAGRDAGRGEAGAAALVGLFLLRTCLLVLPAAARAAARARAAPAAGPAAPRALAVVAAEGAALAAHVEQAVSLYQFRYASAASAALQRAALPSRGLALGLLGAAAARAAHAARAVHAARAARSGACAPRGAGLLAPLARVAHLVLVDLVLAALRAGLAGGLAERLALGVLVLLGLDAAGALAVEGAGTGWDPAGAGAGLLAEVRGFALWRVASDAAGGLRRFEAALAAAAALLAAAGALALGEAGGDDDHYKASSAGSAKFHPSVSRANVRGAAAALAGTLAEVALAVATQTLIARASAVVGDSAPMRALRVLLLSALLRTGERALGAGH